MAKKDMAARFAAQQRSKKTRRKIEARPGPAPAPAAAPAEAANRPEPAAPRPSPAPRPASEVRRAAPTHSVGARPAAGTARSKAAGRGLVLQPELEARYVRADLRRTVLTAAGLFLVMLLLALAVR